MTSEKNEQDDSVSLLRMGRLHRAPMTPLRLAGLFHDANERLSPTFGFPLPQKTPLFRPASREGQLMIAVCAEILQHPSFNRPEAT